MRAIRFPRQVGEQGAHLVRSELVDRFAVERNTFSLKASR